MIAVKVDQLFLSNMGFVVLLKGVEDERSLPIFIGAAEAQSIAIYMNGVEMPRPLTHDLMKNILDFLEFRLLKIEISDLKDETFFAKLILDRDGDEIEMDARPSDAVAMALRFSAPIYVSSDIMDKSGKVFEQSDKSNEHIEDLSHKSGTKENPTFTHEEGLENALKRAIEHERYEDAARIRDELKRLRHTYTDN